MQEIFKIFFSRREGKHLTSWFKNHVKVMNILTGGLKPLFGGKVTDRLSLTNRIFYGSLRSNTFTRGGRWKRFVSHTSHLKKVWHYILEWLKYKRKHKHIVRYAGILAKRLQAWAWDEIIIFQTTRFHYWASLKKRDVALCFKRIAVQQYALEVI